MKTRSHDRSRSTHRRAIGSEETHVYVARISETSSRSASLHTSLDEAERARADSFRSPDDRTRFIVSHGLAREILARYFGEEPARLAFERGIYGKPAVVRDPATTRPTIEWNMSHSRDLFVMGVTRARPIGIDVEVIGDMPFEPIVAMTFSSNERSALHALPVDERRSAFFTTWTRKEAYAKARGVGIDDTFSNFDVPVTASADARWRLRDLDVAPGYAAALVEAVPARALRVRRITASPLGDLVF